MSTPLPIFRVTFPARHTDAHCEAYLNELGDFADWRRLSQCVYMVMPLAGTPLTRCELTCNDSGTFDDSLSKRSRPNFTLKLVRPGFGPAAELPASSQAPRRHAGCSSPRGFANVIGGNRRAASASARGTGRTA